MVVTWWIVAFLYSVKFITLRPIICSSIFSFCYMYLHTYGMYIIFDLHITIIVIVFPVQLVNHLHVLLCLDYLLISLSIVLLLSHILYTKINS